MALFLQVTRKLLGSGDGQGSWCFRSRWHQELCSWGHSPDSFPPQSSSCRLPKERDWLRSAVVRFRHWNSQSGSHKFPS